MEKQQISYVTSDTNSIERPKRKQRIRIRYAGTVVGEFNCFLSASDFSYGCEERTKKVHTYLKKNPHRNPSSHHFQDYIVEFIDTQIDGFDEVWELGS
jgi:hypothetical protein